MPDPQVSSHIVTLSNGDKVSTEGLDPQSAQILINTIEHQLGQFGSNQHGTSAHAMNAHTPTAEGILHQGLDPLINTSIDFVKDPHNRSMIGGTIGGIGGFALGGPPGALIGAGLGGATGSLAQSHPNQSPFDIGAHAIEDGGMQALMELSGLGISKTLAPAANWAGRRLLTHAFGDQSAVLDQMPGGSNINNLDDLIDQVRRTMPEVKVYNPKAYNDVIDKIKPAIESKEAILAGSEGQNPVDPLAGIHPVTTYEGKTIDPLKDVYTRARSGTGDVQGKVSQVNKTVRSIVGSPTGRGEGTGFINNPNLMEYASKTVESPNPALEDLINQYKNDPKMLEIALSTSNLPESISRELQIPKVKDSITAQKMNELVQGNYQDLADKNAFQFENKGNPAREALQGITRGQKEAYVAAAPSVAPFNKTISDLIPVREAINKIVMGEAAKPAFRFGDRVALATGNPKFALAGMANRPQVGSWVGNTLMNFAENPLTQPASHFGVSNLLRLVRSLMHGEDKK